MQLGLNPRQSAPDPRLWTTSVCLEKKLDFSYNFYHYYENNFWVYELGSIAYYPISRNASLLCLSSSPGGKLYVFHSPNPSTQMWCWNEARNNGVSTQNNSVYLFFSPETKIFFGGFTEMWGSVGGLQGKLNYYYGEL